MYFKTVYPIWTNENKLFESAKTGTDSGAVLSHLIQAQSSNSKYYNDVYNYTDEATNSQAINALMDALRPTTSNKETNKANKNNYSSTPTSSPIKKTSSSSKVIQNLILGQKEPELNSSPRKNPAEAQLTKEKQNVEIASPARTLDNVAADNYLLKEYEQELKRQDTNMLDFNASLTLNSNEFINNQAANNIESSSLARKSQPDFAAQNNNIVNNNRYFNLSMPRILERRLNLKPKKKIDSHIIKIQKQLSFVIYSILNFKYIKSFFKKKRKITSFR